MVEKEGEGSGWGVTGAAGFLVDRHLISYFDRRYGRAKRIDRGRT